MILKGMVQAWNLRMYLQTIGCHFLLFDNDFSIFTINHYTSKFPDLQFAMFYVSLSKIEKSSTWQIKSWAKNSHPADKKKWAKIYPAVGSEEVALADVLATASYSLEDRSDFLVKVLS